MNDPYRPCSDSVQKGPPPNLAVLVRFLLLAVGIGIGCGLLVGTFGCRQHGSGRRAEGRVLTCNGHDLHLLDHFEEAGVIELPLYEEYPSLADAGDALDELLLRKAYKPREVKLFPGDGGKIKLTRMTIDGETGQFLTQDASRGGAGFIEIAAEADLDSYDVLSIRYGADVGGRVRIAWRSPGEANYPRRKQVLSKGREKELRTYNLYLGGHRPSPIEKSLWSVVYKETRRESHETIPSMSGLWQGKLGSLLFMPSDVAARVTIESITLRSTKPVRRLLEDHGRLALLATLSRSPIAVYGANAFFRKFRRRPVVEDGVLALSPSELSFDLNVPPGARLAFGCGVPRPLLRDTKNGVRFRVLISEKESRSEPVEVFRKDTAPLTSIGAYSNAREEIDLSRFEGKTVSMSFRTEPGPTHETDSTNIAAGIWYDPVILVPHRVGPADPVNVILLSVDTLRPDHLGLYGYRRDTSPNIDAFGKKGTVFQNAYSTSSWTLPSHMSMLTSLYPLRHGVFEILDRNGPADQLAPNTPTLAGLLKKAGYYTLALTDGENMFVAAEYGFCLGFRRFNERASLKPEDIWDPATSRRTVDRFLTWLARQRSEPFFAFLHTYQVHEPYRSPAPYGQKYVDPKYPGPLGSWYQEREHLSLIEKKGGPLGTHYEAKDIQHLANLYDGEIAYFDSNFGLLMKGLRELGLSGRTLIVFTSDHGEEFGERGLAARHGHTLYNELLKVPLVFYWPNRIPAGRFVEENVSLVDIMPTILDLCGLEVPDELQGRSLVPLLEGKSGVHRVLHAGGMRHVKVDKRLAILEEASIDGNRKAIDYGEYHPGKRELFNLDSDVKEKKNLLLNHPELAKEEFRYIEAYRNLFGPRRTTGSRRPWAESDEERIRVLRSLGYVK